jgi:hypothetical protein
MVFDTPEVETVALHLQSQGSVLINQSGLRRRIV